MSRRDKIHDAVKNALIKDGWTITADPYEIKYKRVKLQADLASPQNCCAKACRRKTLCSLFTRQRCAR